MTTNAELAVSPDRLSPPAAPQPPVTTPVLDWRRAHERCQAIAKRAAALDPVEALRYE